MPTKTSAEEFYDRFASTYDEAVKSPKFDARHLDEGAKLFQKYVPSTRGSILDIGCGTGLLKELLPGEFDYTGIDVSHNMLERAAQRGYTIIHEPVEEALPKLPNRSYDFVLALSSLLCVKNIHPVIAHIDRIARQSILLSLDQVTEEYKRNCVVPVYDHSQLDFPHAKEDYFIQGWTSPTTGITIQTRMVYIEKAQV
ncbi:class I SAM-dependent DNA methyltransferase [Phormidium sp. CCY1219]|uniref:class I SAM-dependent DNA methyltransferase n=1 Tax=Phormidium sp. CCY1219 TaxID=2886104 RepID=UPI002D1EFB6C|nr:methyltransferase domain-containing protein [Phormidium sp. CCY1219]MEB3829360.1 methyltransferase domain-containing protein [Phormidium sp. CCY1219]